MTRPQPNPLGEVRKALDRAARKAWNKLGELSRESQGWHLDSGPARRAIEAHREWKALDRFSRTLARIESKHRKAKR